MSYRVVVIDTETGGLNPNDHSILSLGAVIIEDGIIEDNFHEYVSEYLPQVTEKALEVNGLSLSQVSQSGIRPYEVVGEFESWLKDHGFRKNIQLVGHNVHFDIGFLKRLYRLADSSYEHRFSHRALCTQSVSQFLMLSGRLPELKSTSLDSLCEFFAITIADRHDALGDAIATAELFDRLVMTVKHEVDII